MDVRCVNYSILLLVFFKSFFSVSYIYISSHQVVRVFMLFSCVVCIFFVFFVLLFICTVFKNENVGFHEILVVTNNIASEFEFIIIK